MPPQHHYAVFAACSSPHHRQKRIRQMAPMTPVQPLWSLYAVSKASSRKLPSAGDWSTVPKNTLKALLGRGLLIRHSSKDADMSEDAHSANV